MKSVSITLRPVDEARLAEIESYLQAAGVYVTSRRRSETVRQAIESLWLAIRQEKALEQAKATAGR